MNGPPIVSQRWQTPGRLVPARALVETSLRPPGLTLGQAAAEAIGEQFRRILRREAGVWSGADPEDLHQMRVASRRLRAALAVFRPGIRLPADAGERRVRELTRVLGNLRDLDIQAEDLRTHYREDVSQDVRQVVDRLLNLVDRGKPKATAAVRRVLSGRRYGRLKSAYATWLEEPRFTALGELPLAAVLPDLLAPGLAALLLHPAWATGPRVPLRDAAPVLHDLRKTAKRARYQAEFFESHYGPDFVSWVEELKRLQDRLGEFQDGEVVLASLLAKPASELGRRALHSVVRRRQVATLADWEQLRTSYLSEERRAQLRRMVNEPVAKELKAGG
jgi:CHAD domain-containing protein